MSCKSVDEEDDPSVFFLMRMTSEKAAGSGPRCHCNIISTFWLQMWFLFFFNIKGRGYDFWAIIVWRHYLGRPPKLSCINLDVLDTHSSALTAAKESLGPWLVFAESREIANYVFWCCTSSFSCLFSPLLLMVFFCIHSCTICSHSSQF